MNRNHNEADWWDYTWNPISGCSPISAGCANCWAQATAKRFGFPLRPTFYPERLTEPSKVRKPSHIAVGLMGDLFHEKVRSHEIDEIGRVITNAGQHTFFVLTKRAERMKTYFAAARQRIVTKPPWKDTALVPNLQLGVSVENDKHLDRIETLQQVPTAKRFVSLEPFLGPVSLRSNSFDHLRGWTTEGAYDEDGDPYPVQAHTNPLDWVIVGAESGPKRRPCKLDWVYSIVDECKSAGVPVWVKQLDIDGKLVKDIDKFPADLRIRERC